MKWKKAIKQIEEALAEGKKVEVRYHRKWARNDMEKNKYGMVETIGTYDWFGQKLKAVTLTDQMLEEGNWIIDEINTWKEGD